jgi:MerR family transcriptional regulator, light-induced transcriptional regulator
MNFEPGDRLRAVANAIAEAAVAHDYERRPILSERYGERGRANYLQDMLYDVAYLACALDVTEPAIFADYVAWLKTVLVHRGVLAGDIAESLQSLVCGLERHFQDDDSGAAVFCVTQALEQLPAMPVEVPSFLVGAQPHTVLARTCLEALVRLDREAAIAALEQALGAGTSISDIHLKVLPPLMREVGRLWQLNQISVAHEHYCSAAIQLILARFYDRVFSGGRNRPHSILLTCVEGELHELGARTVADVFELSGWRSHFLGANVPRRELLDLMAARPPDVVGISMTMPFNLNQLASTVSAVRESSGTSRVPVVVGGYPFARVPRMAEAVGADLCVADAATAVAQAEQLVANAG